MKNNNIFKYQLFKKWYLSKTVWLGAIACIVAGLEAYQNDPNWIVAALAAFGALSVVIRTQTSKKLTK